MRHVLIRIALLLASTLVAMPAAAADIGIMPVAVHFDKTTERATVQVVNNGKDPVIMQAEGIAWKRVSGVDQDSPSGDLIVNPPIFTVQPGQTQIVRLGLRRSAQSAAEGTYRMVLREVPPADGADVVGVSGQVRVLVALRVPVYVAPASVQRRETWKASIDNQGNLVAHVSNSGNVHLKVGRLRLQNKDDASTAVAEQTIGAVLFPGEERSFPLATHIAKNATMPGQMTLEVLTDRGLQYVALDIPRSR